MAFKKAMRLKSSHVVFGGLAILFAGILLWNFVKNTEGFQTSSTDELTPENMKVAKKLEINVVQPMVKILDSAEAYINSYVSLPSQDHVKVTNYLQSKYKDDIIKIAKIVNPPLTTKQPDDKTKQ